MIPKNPEQPSKTIPEKTHQHNFLIDAERKQIYYCNQLLNATRLEFFLLQTLVSQPGRVFSRDQLLMSIGTAMDAGYDRSIDSHIKSLRAKLRNINMHSEPIKTHRGFGYSYDTEA